MDKISVITNHCRRPVLYGWDLVEEERGQFDYVDWEEIEDGSDSTSFVRYKGELYDLQEFELAPKVIADLGWHGFMSYSYFSGLAIRYVYDEYGEYDVVVAYVHW